MILSPTLNNIINGSITIIIIICIFPILSFEEDVEDEMIDVLGVIVLVLSIVEVEGVILVVNVDEFST